MKNKFISGALALGMLATMAVPAFAEEQSSPITVDLQPTVMSVKVPTQLPIGVNADGSSSGAVTAHIQNNSAAQVEVTDVRVEAATDWTIKSWNTDWSNAALGTKEFAFKLNGNEVATDGSVDAELGVINGSGEKLAFTYEGRIAPQDGTGTATLGNVVFTMGWVDGGEATTKPTFEFWINGPFNMKVTADEDMTWEQWVNSEYNTWNYLIEDNHIYNKNLTMVITQNGEEVLADMVIVGNDDYELKDIISFTINDASYQAAKDMTWGNWVKSTYNPLSGDGVKIFKIEGGHLYHLYQGDSIGYITNTGGLSYALEGDVIDPDVFYDYYSDLLDNY